MLRQEHTLKIWNQRCLFYLCGKLPDVFELETLGFVDWIDVVADKFPKQSVSTGRAPAELTSELEFSCDCNPWTAAGCVGFGLLN